MTGPYAGSILRFTLTFPTTYPRARPAVHFDSDVFHRECILLGAGIVGIGGGADLLGRSTARRPLMEALVATLTDAVMKISDPPFREAVFSDCCLEMLVKEEA